MASFDPDTHTCVTSDDFIANIRAANAANEVPDVTTRVRAPGDDTEVDDTKTTLTMFYKGAFVSQYLEPGKRLFTIADYATLARIFIAPGVGREWKAALHATMDRLACELHEALGSVYTMRQVLKLWGDDFTRKHGMWFAYASILLELGTIKNDDKHGWLVCRVEEGCEAAYLTAEHIFDTCVVCAKRGAFKRCPCSKKMRYCGDECRDLDWKCHKAQHKRTMAKRAAKDTARAGAGAAESI